MCEEASINLLCVGGKGVGFSNVRGDIRISNT